MNETLKCRCHGGDIIIIERGDVYTIFFKLPYNLLQWKYVKKCINLPRLHGIVYSLEWCCVVLIDPQTHVVIYNKLTCINLTITTNSPLCSIGPSWTNDVRKLGNKCRFSVRRKAWLAACWCPRFYTTPWLTVDGFEFTSHCWNTVIFWGYLVLSEWSDWDSESISLVPPIMVFSVCVPTMLVKGYCWSTLSILWNTFLLESLSVLEDPYLLLIPWLRPDPRVYNSRVATAKAVAGYNFFKDGRQTGRQVFTMPRVVSSMLRRAKSAAV